MMNLIRKLMGQDASAGSATPASRQRALGLRRKRGFQRHPVKVPAVVKAAGRTIEGMSGSMGLGGLFLLCPNPLPPHTRVTVELEPPVGGVPAIQARGAVAYAAPDGMGIRFTSLSQSDCRYLRSLFLQAVKG